MVDAEKPKMRQTDEEVFVRFAQWESEVSGDRDAKNVTGDLQNWV